MFETQSMSFIALKPSYRLNYRHQQVRLEPALIQKDKMQKLDSEHFE